MDTSTDQIERPQWLDRDVYPFTLRQVDLSTGPVAYVDEGQGPVLLFVHAGMWSFVFRDVIADLSTDFRCVTLDFPGSGLTPAHEGVVSIADMSAILAEFVQTLDLGHVTLVVHDLGGLVGLGAASGDASRYAGLVMANSFAWTPDRISLRAMLRVMGSSTMTAIDVATNFLPRLSGTSFGVGRHLDRDSRLAFRGPFEERGPRRTFHALMRSVLGDPDHTDAVAAATNGVLSHLPVLSIYGERNDPFGFQDRVTATWRDHEGLVIDNGNHFPMCDDPELFAETLRRWHAGRVA